MSLFPLRMSVIQQLLLATWTQGRRERVRAQWKYFLRSPGNCRPAKNLDTKSERMTLSCTVTWAWSEIVNLYNRQIMILPRNTKTCVTYSGSGSRSGLSGPGNLYRLPLPISSALLGPDYIVSRLLRNYRNYFIDTASYTRILDYS
jgi:hypothetical protein